MEVNQKNVRWIGGLFLAAMVLYGVGNTLISSTLDSSSTALDRLNLGLGILLSFGNSMAVVVLAVVIYPYLEIYNKRIALGYLCARLFEALMLAVGMISLLSVAGLEQSHPKVDAAQLIVMVAQKSNFWAYQLAMLTLGVGSIGFCYTLWKLKWVPTFLAIWGLVGYLGLALGAIFELFGYPIGLIMSLPGGLFEVAFGIWLCLKGLSFDKINAFA
ncbi:DUF4386 domain-containing protein [Runella sp. MFBS21]|uniref:DUF4386 domain-containing protein n=1 Tax=Runella sp. MFBS21 TaxID=3034018 RepID=UPI0023F82B3B|nr:DUF4386 domain-containing protein [Runella sp. MFBS21]MDF7817542.1 DUF4386 domain-containing protein [Runella sp. MFBS21]